MISVGFHDPKKAEHGLLHTVLNDCLKFLGEGGNEANLFVPRHVAEHTAAAFNRAMQAEKQRDGSLKYSTESGDWFISLDSAMRKVWQFQSDEVTGDGDPSWLHGAASDPIDAMDQIDDLIAEHACPECKAMVGEDKLNETEDGEFLCWDCDEKRAEHLAGMQEMVADDKAHAAMDMARGL